MHGLQEIIFLVIPCYNEEKRLDMNKFLSSGHNVFFLFVDDGSNDSTAEVIRRHLSQRVHILSLDKNYGKQEAVRQGMLHLKTMPFWKDVSWAGFWDADLATPLEELNDFMGYQKALYPDCSAVLGSRVLRLGSVIKRFAFRHYCGRFFATMVGVVLKIKVYDSQCGAKIFRKEVIDICFKDRFIVKWLFDLEIILRLLKQGSGVVEYPLRLWQDVAGSKFSLFKEIIPSFLELFKLKAKYK
ncbi:MAG: glycosyltransferase [Candidatus Omnitrophica bacterium]|jgi:glycosyltransferase involved in cell wall biosynthesis|nr:glycosyltransferase [Candidatus Omnitrophota bacterium]